MEERRRFAKKQVFSRLLENLNRRDRGLWGNFILYTLTAGLYPMFAVLLPKLLIAELTKGAQANLGVLLAIVGGFFVLSAGFGLCYAMLQGRAYSRISLLRLDYVAASCRKLLAMEYKYHRDAEFLADNQNAWQATSNNNNGVEGIYHRLYEAPARLLTALLLVVTVALLSPWLLLALAVNLALSVLAVRAADRYRYRMRNELRRKGREIWYYRNRSEDFSYGKDIRIYKLRDRVEDNFRTAVSGYVACLDLCGRREFLWGLLALVGLLCTDAATYFILIRRTVSGMSIADFSMYLAAVLALGTLLKQLSADVAYLLNESLYVHDLYAFLDSDIDARGGKRKRIVAETLEVEFRDVGFRYPHTDKWVLRHFDFHIRKGERLAVVGVNGAGKSTLVLLLTGLYQPEEGNILINGIPSEEFDRHELYAMFSVVFQEVNLLAFSVAENVAARTGEVDRERVAEALRRTGLEPVVAALPKGMDQPVLKIIEEDGVEFSGGEAQKLAIARALYKDANMVVMDEPTAALDALAEADIYERFSALVRGKTAVYISHRLASTRFCDRIAFFENGALKECGTHDELMAERGAYYRMFTVQGQYYAEEGSDERLS